MIGKGRRMQHWSTCHPSGHILCRLGLSPSLLALASLGQYALCGCSKRDRSEGSTAFPAFPSATLAFYHLTPIAVTVLITGNTDGYNTLFDLYNEYI